MKLFYISALCAMSVSTQAATVFTENFDSATQSLTVTTAGQFSAINGTNVDIIGPPSFALCAAPESGNCVDMGGTGGNAFGDIDLTNPLNLAAGTYFLSFDLIGSGRGQTTSTTVTFGSYTQTFVLTSGDVTTGIIVNQAVVLPAGPTQLEFKYNNVAGETANIGALLDNVTITNSVPEPSSMILLGSGLVLASLIRRRAVR
jgi:hypothetical protein